MAGRQGPGEPGALQISELKAVGGPVLHPITASTGSDNLDGTGSAPLVDAGSGTPEELAAAGAKDAVVLVKAVDGALYEVARNAEAAGAKAVLAHREAPGRWVAFTGYAGGALPTMAIEAAEGQALLARLKTGPGRSPPNGPNGPRSPTA
ncbi:PA domain-containing protein [Streptomyces sp. NBC_01233]|uniref:PA domain-containing protein n=1 Tax=Streptomyces sp. NBC_01233 TaxID=2903787 RepID=UPI002E0E321C|nr:hypothetical protein OG332_34845 [Streptomyces sp. NBC_01233]